MSALGQEQTCEASNKLVRFVPIPDLRAPSVEVSNRSRSVAARRGVSAGICRCGKNDQSG